MSTLTENEVDDRLKSAIGEARDACRNLAVRSAEGRDYSSLRDSLMLIEGCCRQMAAFRADYRWLPVGMQIAECHKRAGSWLRGYEDKGVHVKWEPGTMNKMFVMLGQVLEQLGIMAEKIRTERTGIKGPILPDSMLAAPERKAGRIGFTPAKKPNGLIIPAKYRKAG
jgi:hypothetical protein